ncbi:MAG: hypothetical protein H8E44_05545 [Planctomycetes bacterium]|nr:hypothetical protein [Planctomycetota bacterium]MBL7042094.1 hypothetical protein [Pirellulaceae bacterium]
MRLSSFKWISQSDREYSVLAVEYAATAYERLELLAQGKLARLPAASQYAADKSYFSTAAKLCEGLERAIQSYRDSEDLHKTRACEIWNHILAKREAQKTE